MQSYEVGWVVKWALEARGQKKWGKFLEGVSGKTPPSSHTATLTVVGGVVGLYSYSALLSYVLVYIIDYHAYPCYQWLCLSLFVWSKSMNTAMQ